MHLSVSKIFFVFITLIGCVANPAIGQNAFYFNLIGGNYQMTDLKNAQKLFGNQQAPYNFKTAMNFPISLQAEVESRHQVGERLSIGGFTNFAITRGKVGYADFSGQQSTTQNVVRSVNGAAFNLTIHQGFSVYLKAGICYSHDKIVGLLDLNGGPRQTSSVNFYSFGITLHPGVSWVYKFNGPYTLQAQAGYEYNVQGKTVGDSGASLTVPGGDNDVRINWSGFRLGVGIGYNF